MNQLTVDLGERSYPILIGKGLLRQLPQQLAARGIEPRQTLFIVSDEHVAPLYLEQVVNGLEQAGYRCGYHIVPAGEQVKSLAYLEEITGKALEIGLDRNSVFLALGGGVIGDLTGFCAAAYMRGVPFVQIPTTLLAHDSSVGGKVAVNHPLGKNIIGAFHQPSLVLYDTETLTTLPKREIYAGFAEVLKHGLIWSESFTNWLSDNASSLLSLESPFIEEAIQQGCAIKAEVVSNDEREQGLRAILNLGHTFGHALEAISSYGGLIHGEAISIGMVAAALLAERIGLTKAEDRVAERTISLLKQYHLPVQLPSAFAIDDILAAMRHDKKGKDGKFVFVLPTAIGAVEIVENVDEADIIETLKICKEVE
ncbi:3-dehydroquinate synthase [Ammoniphilus oxalaticus]|uniref:3-dehydroquinate synthase n=1 Tax=Ammoniphilus oxalaticus TaxID=66863 RepID=A0A419SN38_9BACL|nr:3-dehydroquinate synthase [Ammoniphilus oxalaticus]RKD25708.1 3-dehydroquinate synthase [Ammoniphilus oxalaticus]